MGGAAPRTRSPADRPDGHWPEERPSRRKYGWWVVITLVMLFLLARLFTDDGTNPIRDDDNEQELRTVGSLVTQPPRATKPHVTVESRNALVDGQIVEVSGTGFNDDAEVEIRQCAGELGCTRLEPVETTGESGTYRTSFKTDSAGTFKARVAVRRFVVGLRGDPPFDCSEPSGSDRCDLSTVVYFTGRSQYPTPVLLHFTDGDAARKRPTVVADATSGLVGGQRVRMVGLGFTAGSTVVPMLCTAGPGTECVTLRTVEPVQPVRDDTSLELEVIVPNTAGGLDCRQARSCTITLTPQSSGGFPTPAPLPVSFVF